MCSSSQCNILVHFVIYWQHIWNSAHNTAVHKVMLDHLLVCPLSSRCCVFLCLKKNISQSLCWEGKVWFIINLPQQAWSMLGYTIISLKFTDFYFCTFFFKFSGSFSFTCLQLILGYSNLMNDSARADLIDFGLLLITVNEIMWHWNQ